MIGNRPRLAVIGQPTLWEAAPRQGPSPDIGWEQAIQLFLDCWAADRPGVRTRTLEHYREQLQSRLARFAVQRGITRVCDFGRYDLRAFIGWLESYVTYRQVPLAPRGKQMALTMAKTFFRWLSEEQIAREDIGARTRSYRLDSSTEPRATPRTYLEQLLRSFDRKSPTGIRNTAMVHLMAFCGLRVSELVGLNLADLDLVSGRVRVRAETSKGRRTRMVDLPLAVRDGCEVVRPEVTAALGAWLEARHQIARDGSDDSPLFVAVVPGGPRRVPQDGDAAAARVGQRLTTDGVRCILDRIARRAGIPPRLVMPHRLRHYFGLASAIAGVPTTALMRAMGHVTPIMTARYSEFADTERRQAFARADILKGIELPGP